MPFDEAPSLIMNSSGMENKNGEVAKAQPKGAMFVFHSARILEASKFQSLSHRGFSAKIDFAPLRMVTFAMLDQTIGPYNQVSCLIRRLVPHGSEENKSSL